VCRGASVDVGSIAEELPVPIAGAGDGEDDEGPLLLVRELPFGPKRFSDLRAGLPLHWLSTFWLAVPRRTWPDSITTCPGCFPNPTCRLMMRLSMPVPREAVIPAPPWLGTTRVERPDSPLGRRFFDQLDSPGDVDTPLFHGPRLGEQPLVISSPNAPADCISGRPWGSPGLTESGPRSRQKKQ